MKIEKFENTQQVKILEGMIFNPTVMSKIAELWKEDLPPFGTSYANLLGKMCVSYWTEHGKPPLREGIKILVEDWEANQTNDSNSKLVVRLLEGILDDYDPDETVDPQHLIAITTKYFSKIRYDRAVEKANSFKEQGRLQEAYDCLGSLRPIEMGLNAGSFIITGEDDLMSLLFTEDDKPNLITYDGPLRALGRFFGNLLQRDSFVSFIGKEGVGKTWWLVEIAIAAFLNRCKVAFFEVGDMSRVQIARRLVSRTFGRPLNKCEVNKPISISKDGVDLKRIEYALPLAHKEIKLKCQDIVSSKIKSKNPYFWLETHSACSISIGGIRASLTRLERDHNWKPDVIIIDYADILAPPEGTAKKDSRDQINETWMQMRRMSTDMHGLVVTATQANRQAYDVDIIRMKHMSEEKRKLSHVTGMIAINRNDDEKKSGVYRLGLLKAREMEFSPSKCVYVAGCLGMGRPAILATWGNEVKLTSKSKENSDKRGGG